MIRRKVTGQALCPLGLGNLGEWLDINDGLGTRRAQSQRRAKHWTQGSAGSFIFLILSHQLLS